MGSLKSTLKLLAADAVYGHMLPNAYRKACAQYPMVKGRVVFVENNGSTLSENFSLISQRLEKHLEYSQETVFLHETTAGLKGRLDNSKASMRALAEAEYIFLNDASQLVSCLPLRDGTRAFQLWHACGAFKKWGLSCVDLKYGADARMFKKHPYYANLSLVSVSSPDVSWAYQEAMGIADASTIKPLGVSRTDVFFNQGFLVQSKEKLARLFPAADGKQVILYAPTFRGRPATAATPHDLDIRMLKERFADTNVLIIKQHPFVKDAYAIPEECASFAYEVSGELSISELLACADVCITDYSSIVFEYSLLDRPICFFATDLEDYRSWRDFYYDFEEMTPGPVFTTSEDVVNWVDATAHRFSNDRIAEFRDKFMRACDGHSTDRICTEVFGSTLV